MSGEKGKPIQLSRLTSAWQEGQLLLQRRNRHVEGILEDPDEPLIEIISESLQMNWQPVWPPVERCVRYGLSTLPARQCLDDAFHELYSPLRDSLVFHRTFVRPRLVPPKRTLEMV